jgi:small subunit ribosomal protein S17
MPEGGRKVRVGEVVGDKMDKTVVVAVKWQQRHRLYKKSIRRVTRFFVHDKDNQCKLGDLVRIEETRPLSRMKHWRVMEILQRREVAEVKPIELEEGLLSEIQGKVGEEPADQLEQEDAAKSADSEEDEDPEVEEGQS